MMTRALQIDANNNNNDKIIIGLESVLASKDVIGDLPSPWATINS